MKPIFSMMLFTGFLAGCQIAADLDLITPVLNFESSPAGTIVVRDKEYKITRTEGTDKETGELFVVQFSTVVDGRKVRCVGTIEKCPAVIERALDGELKEEFEAD